MLRTIIIDDEDHQRLNLEKMVKLYCSDLEIIAMADGIKTGVRAIKKHGPDLVLLDIKLNDGTGFELLEALQPINFKVIFITAFDQYAIRAFRISALDYLLKPVDPDELCQAAKKAGEIIQKDFNIQLSNFQKFLHPDDKTLTKIIIKTHDNIHLVSVQDILFCESDNNYTRFHLSGHKQIMVSATLKDYEDILAESGFFRIHKSYLVNIKNIRRFERGEGGSVVLEGDLKIPVSSRKRDELLGMLDKLTNLLPG
ncbi:MAG: DNA-binding response regulator [Bacteroidetes bacterium]|nr:MAG: DNA-binding response regulator [Bacteroidota bacterium]